jgi:hypothetical protein
MCKDKGFLAIDPDNTDGYQTATGFPLTAADTRSFLTNLSDTARAKGLAIGLKNTVDLIDASLTALFDFAVNEECYNYQECDKYGPFKTGQ